MKFFLVRLFFGILIVLPLIAYAADGSNYVNVYSCRDVEGGIMISREAKEPESLLSNGIRDAGHGLRDYSLKCVAQDRYYVEWKELSPEKKEPASVSATALPDFIVKDILQAPNQAVANYGDVLTIRVKNVGAGDAPEDSVGVFIWIDDQLEWTYNSSTFNNKDFLKAGGTTDVQPQILRGKHRVKSCVDYNQSFKESDESNNCMEVTLIGPEGTSVTPSTPSQPSPSSCKTGMNSFSVEEECGNGLYRYANYLCYDGLSGKLGSPTSCKPSATWSQYVQDVCKGRSQCSTPTPSPVPSPVSPTPAPACAAPYVLYQGQCVDPIPACENPPANVMPSSCIDKIENGRRISRYNFQCMEGYVRSGNECTPATNSCQDSDGGEKSDIQGTVFLPGEGTLTNRTYNSQELFKDTSAGRTWYDTCMIDIDQSSGITWTKAPNNQCSGGDCYVIEYACTGRSNDVGKYIQCSNGCSNGACLAGPSQPAPTTTDTTCAGSYLLYQGKCTNPFPACHNPPANMMPNSCVDKIENGKRISRYHFECRAEYSVSGSECVKSTTGILVTIASFPRSTNETSHENGYLEVKVGDKIQFYRLIEQKDIVYNGWNWHWDKSVLDCSLTPNADNSEIWCKVISETSGSVVSVTVSPVTEDGRTLEVESNLIKVYTGAGRSAPATDDTVSILNYKIEANAVTLWLKERKLGLNQQYYAACRLVDVDASDAGVYQAINPIKVWPLKSGMRYQCYGGVATQRASGGQLITNANWDQRIFVTTLEKGDTVGGPVPVPTPTRAPLPTFDTGIPSAGYEDEVVTAQAQKNPFSDTDLKTLVGQAAANLYALGIIGGYPDGTFKGDRRVNRAEAAKFLLLSRYSASALQDARNEGKFWDVLDSQWYTRFIINAYFKGIMSGYPDGSMGPGKNVNTAEFLKMLSLNFALSLDLSYSYQDVPRDSWFAPYAGIAQQYNLFPERKGKLYPASELSRAEVAVALYQYLSQR